MPCRATACRPPARTRAATTTTATAFELLLATTALCLAASGAAASATDTRTEVCLGVVLPLTSSRHIESLRVMDAIALAVNDVNADPTRLPGFVVRTITDPALVDSRAFVRYGATRVHSQFVEARCANGTAPVAFVGDIDNAVCQQMATLATLFDVPMVSPGCRDPVFDAREQNLAYPMFARTISNLMAEADLMESLMDHYAFGELVLWHSDSLIGAALGRAFANTRFELVDVPVPAGDDGTEVARTLARIRSLRVRIVFVHAEERLGRLMLGALRRAGMLNGDYLVLGSSLWTYGADAANRVDFNEEERDYLQGVVGIGLSEPPPAVGDAFQGRLRGLSKYLYPPFNTQALVSTTWHAYDAVTLLAAAINNVTATQQLPAGHRDALNGPALMNAIRGGTLQFTGVVGDDVQMLPDGGWDPTFSLTNFRGGAFVPVGTWRRRTGLDLHTPIVWPGHNAELHPVDAVPRTLLRLDPAWADAGIAVMALCLLVSLLLHYLIHANASHEVIKAASPMFCHIIIFGAELCFVMAGLSALDFAAAYCRLVPTMVSVSFSTIFGALLAKTYRIHRIFNSEGLKINAPTSAYLLTVTGIVAGYDVVLSIVFMLVDPPFLVNSPSPDDETTQFPDCGTISAPRWWAAFVVPKGVMLLFGAWLAYKVRHLNHNFNEAKYISLALYNVIILSAILMSLVLTFPGQINTTYALKTVGCALSGLITLCILFVPKFWDIYVTKDWIDYHSNSSYISGVLLHKSSKTGQHHTGDQALVGGGKGGGATVAHHHHHHSRRGPSGNGGGATAVPTATAGGFVAGPHNTAAASTSTTNGGGGGGGSGSNPGARYRPHHRIGPVGGGGGGGGSAYLHRPSKQAFATNGGRAADSKTPPPPPPPGFVGAQNSPKRFGTGATVVGGHKTPGATDSPGPIKRLSSPPPTEPLLLAGSSASPVVGTLAAGPVPSSHLPQPSPLSKASSGPGGAGGGGGESTILHTVPSPVGDASPSLHPVLKAGARGSSPTESPRTLAAAFGGGGAVGAPSVSVAPAATLNTSTSLAAATTVTTTATASSAAASSTTAATAGSKPPPPPPPALSLRAPPTGGSVVIAVRDSSPSGTAAAAKDGDAAADPTTTAATTTATATAKH